MWDSVSVQTELKKQLRARGISAESDAFAPLKRVDFERLKDIHDHEEQYIRSLLLDNITAVTSNRPIAPLKRATKADVRTALLMLGAAAAQAPTQALRASSKARIRSACPYC